MKFGAKLDETDHCGTTPLALAVSYGQFNMVKFLTQKGVEVDRSQIILDVPHFMWPLRARHLNTQKVPQSFVWKCKPDGRQT